MAVFRIEKTRDYTVMSNYRDKRQITKSSREPGGNVGTD